MVSSSSTPDPTPRDGRESAVPDDWDDYSCHGYPEHDYQQDEEDGLVIYRCRRCDAEYWDDDER